MDIQTVYKLIVNQGPSPGEQILLTGLEMTIGREGAVDILISAPAVSRSHARLVQRGEGYWIEDHGSSNGTYVNGKRITDRVRLNPGDQIGLGQSILLTYSVVPPKSTPAGTAEDPYQTRAIQSGALEDNFRPQAPVISEVRTPPAPPAASSPPPAVAEQMPPNGALAATVIGEEIDLDGQNIPPSLIVTVAGEQSQTYTLGKPQFTLGRTAGNDIVINSKIVSRQHATLERIGQGYKLVVSPQASNPIFFEGRQLAGSQMLQHGSTLRIGSADPGLMVSLRYDAPAEIAAGGAETITFGDKTIIQLGRDPGNDVVLNSPSISRFHSQIERVGQRYRIQDLRSSNGTFVNDRRIEAEVWLKPEDAIRIGPYRFVMGQDQLAQFDESGGLRVEAVGLNKWVRKDLNILQDISLIFNPREFVVVVGQSGGGKSTLVDSIAGYRPATHGRVLVNDIDVYRNFDAVRSDIGFVPQKDIIHMELTVYQALDYAARLRMPPDTSKQERHQRVLEVLKDLDLTHRKDVQISGLSGGQQKRVSIGVELLTKPGLFFLDEPTSGLDPGTETALMQLMRRMADQGRTIVLITHATKNVMLADKVVFLARGGYLAWFGPPDEALKYFDQFRSEREQRTVRMEFDQIYAILDDASKGSPQDWADRFMGHTTFREYISQPLQENGHLVAEQAGVAQPSQRTAASAAKKGAVKKERRSIDRRSQVSGLRQFFILSARNLKILTRDRFSLFLMLAAAPIIAMLDFVLASAMGSDVFAYVEGNAPGITTSLFLLTVYGVMIGGLSQMREIVKEQDIYKRERLVNLKVFPYVLSKIWVAALLALYQTAAYVIIHYLAFEMPGGATEFILIYITLALATMAGMMLGLFSSVVAPNANSAPLIVILLMLPQIVLGGALIPLPQAVSSLTSTRWAFEALMGITGSGSDVAADICYDLPLETRQLMNNDDKVNYGCLCLGPNIFDPDSCSYPGVGQFYDPVIEQDAPLEPPPLGDAPPEPEIPEPPIEPVDQADQVAMAQYLEDLKEYQATVDQIQADYKAEVDAYQGKVDVYQSEAITYQQSYAEWQIGRNAAIGAAEAIIIPIERDYGWTYVDKDDPDIYWAKIISTWRAQATIILVLLLAILILIRRKDKVQ